MKRIALIATIAALLTGNSRAATNATPAKVTKAQIVEALTRVMNDKDPRVRAGAAQTLGEFGLKEFVPVLINLLDDDEPTVRRAAVQALGKLGDHSAAPIMIGELQTAFMTPVTNAPGILIKSTSLPDVFWLRNVEKQARTIRALGELRAPAAVEVLIAHGLNSPEIGICIVTAVALGKIKDRRAAEPLQAILEAYYKNPPPEEEGVIGDPKTRVLLEEIRARNAYYRAAICWALGEIGDAGSRPVLRLANDDRNSLVRDAATEAINKLSSR